ncbi:tRNA methyl transferase-like domain protein, partial [mine drainage metagenome]
GPDELTVTFDQPVAAITPGQAVVCYNGDVLLGGGWIDHVVEEGVKLPQLDCDAVFY